MSVYLVIGLVVLAGGALAGVIYWMRHAAQNAAVLAQTDAALSSEEAHVAALEAAAAEKRRKRRLGFDVKAAAVSDAATAAELLRSATDPDTN